MSLYHEAAEFLLSSPNEGGSLKARIFKKKNTLKSPPNQLYALVLETSKWSPVLKDVIDRAELLKHERKVSCANSFTDLDHVGGRLMMFAAHAGAGPAPGA